jgi:type IV secretion system protein VirB11
MSDVLQFRGDAEQAGVVKTLLLPFAPFLGNKSLFEVVINQPGQVLTEGMNGWQSHDVPELTFARLSHLARAVASYSNQTINDTHPVLSATLPDGERIQIVIPPATQENIISLTIRKPSTVSFTLDDMRAGGFFDEVKIASEDLTAEEIELQDLLARGDNVGFLKRAVQTRKNIIISGATGSGKTTLSKALIKYIPDDERIITIEDTPELEIPQPNHVRLYYSKGNQGRAKVGPKELLESCLRMRPDRILLQELRDGTAFYYIRNVNSGHPGSITTVHADSARLAFEQLTLLVKESEGGQDLERDDIRKLLYLLVDVVVQCKRINGQFRAPEIYFNPMKKRELA